MAKLNITFVNEVGNNLNRYKAIDVNTGDEYLFDLSRNGTITTPGTPLNAEIMNAIVQAINEHFSNLVVAINNTTPSDTKYPSEKAVVDYVGQFANEESVDVSDNVLIKISGVSDNLALPPESQMEINSIEGNSVVVNQSANLAYDVSFGTTRTVNGMDITFYDGYIICNGTATDNIGIVKSANIIANHKYINKGGKSNAFGRYDYYDPDIVYLETANVDNDSYSITILSGTTYNNKKIPVYVIDLTQWFGSNDNIPQDILNTPSNFFKHYKGSLAYDTGHIENGSGNLVDTNRNIWDEQWGNYLWDETDNGIRKNNNGCFGCNDYINVIPDTTYYFRAPTSSFYILFYDNNKNYLSHIFTTSNNTFNTPANCRYITFYSYNSYGNTYKHDICINVSDTNFNGTYVAHIKNTLNFGNDILRSAGNARDKKIPDGEIERKVGRVDLGTLDWTKGGTNFYAPFISVCGAKQPTNAQTPKLLCSKQMTPKSQDGVSGNIGTFEAYINQDGYLYWYYTLEDFVDGNTFKTAMSGVYLNYELATPTTEQGTPYDNYIPVYYGGQEFTTGDVPFVINKNYDISIKDQVLTNVRVDKEQSEQIHALENVNREQSNAIDSLNAKVNNLETTQEAHSTSINSLNTKVTDLENYKFDSSKLKIEQNLVNTILKYNNVEIDRIENLDVAYLPNIVFDVYQDTQFTAQEKVTITNSTDMDMYVSIKGLKEHNNLSVPFGESVTSQLTASIESSLPNSYIATIEIKIYYNPKTNYNATTGYTVFENVKTINLRATVHPTDR